ncbi:NB-ARC domain-containing protein [Amycolatopsis sp. cg5]|uniref:ATP-binding protein n=1 Tax=Amycolatopsis sp. cg5 TaxID=3238802 RepID=UPI003525480A
MGTERFGELLRFYRLRSSITQEELAERTGLSSRAISYMEGGRVRTPHRRTVELLAEGLELAGDEAKLFGDAARAGQRAVAEQATGEPPDSGVTCVLPPVLVELTGRDAELAALAEYADKCVASAKSQIAVIHGLPGAGKTALAIEAAHHLKARFEHGCFFLDLRGMDADPLTPEQAMRRVLHVLGVEARTVPTNPDDLRALYVSLLRDRTMLLVFDNATDEAQVRPLLAGTHGSLVLVTSRNTLVGIDVRHRIALDRLDDENAIELLGLVVGEHRVAAEPEAANRLAALCGGVPLALMIAGNRLASRARWTIEHLVGRLEDERSRLSVLSAGDLQVRAAFEISYHQLEPDAARMFRRLALISGSAISVDLATVASGLPAGTAEMALEKLADASLLGADGAFGRYTCHDLLRVFARERLELAEDAEEIEAARLRLRHWLLETATKAAGYFSHDDREMAGTARETGPAHDRRSAAEWLELEQGNWRSALRDAAAEHEHRRVLDLAAAMHWYSDLRGDGELWREVFGAGVEAARALGDRRAEADQCNYLSWALYILCGQPDKALEAHRGALAAAQEVGDPTLEAWTWYYGSAIISKLSEPAEGVRWNRRAVALFEQAGYPEGQYLAMSFLGKQLHGIGGFDEAVALHRRCVAWYRSNPSTPANDEVLSMVLTRLAESLAAVGDIPSALVHFDEAEALFREHGATQGVARVQSERGKALVKAHRLDEAAVQLRSALRLLDGHRLADGRIEILVQLAEICDQRDEPEQARTHRRQALAECARCDTPAARAAAGRLATELGVPDVGSVGFLAK